MGGHKEEQGARRVWAKTNCLECYQLTYLVWQEKNNRTFAQTETNEGRVIEQVRQTSGFLSTA